MLSVGSLFSGIGGFDLGLERAGMRTLWFCEQDEFCQRVLAKHWPGVPCHPDVRALVADTGAERRKRRTGEPGEGRPPAERRQASGDACDGGSALVASVPVPVPYVDVLCGGFPCQDISLAGKGAGIDGARSGLWSEYARLIREIRPRYVVVENVAALLARGGGRVLGDLAAIGYDAEWDCIPASAIGAPHRRDRIWLVAYPHGPGPQGPEPEQAGGRAGSTDLCPNVADAQGEPLRPRLRPDEPGAERRGRSGDGGSSADFWLVEPDVGRVAHGVPARVDRLRALGNALVPQIAEWIGQRIVDFERREGTPAL